MTTYEKLDILADTYAPALLCALIALILKRLWMGERRQARTMAMVSAGALALVYTLRGVDAWWRIYAAWGLDYSTHTAFALVVVAVLAFYVTAWRIKAVILLSFPAYLWLMFHQQYHSMADMLVTAANIGVPLAAWLYFCRRRGDAD